MQNPLKNIGPGALVTAAFIGPGTVTVCTLAGVQFGYELLWALVVSIIATVILQEMAARLGIVSQAGLSTAIRNEIKTPLLRVAAILIILSAIVIGNAAYEAGNISGGVLGLETLFSYDVSAYVFPSLIGLIAFILLFIGNYRIIEKALVSLVILMSLAFLITAILTRPDLSDLFKGMLVPNLDANKLLMVMALVGTTVVPYNLFLHASLVKEHWKSPGDLPLARKDTYVSIILGGVVSIAIVVCAAAVQSSDINNAADLALGLEPLLGIYAKYFLALGLFAAGITSAITAPLAAAYVASNCLAWDAGLKDKRFRAVWMFILLLGMLSALSGIKSIEIIKFAQITNGILLPVIAMFLLWVMNKRTVLGDYVNSTLQNIIGGLVVLFTLFLGAKSLAKVFGFLG
ncbi:MAG: Nramp family divalent metal transporter [Gammaproteobacteria bacterium]|nr:Nramp family divalent metal transporter [Gammaproteobacteria bacterium]NNC96914.1 Nramp family divalent metal transporter [Gammaproteobacteria bacterium]NNM13329.1 Nramp family divalent metal transporter [Gammaproteobacteria bacterium]